MSKTSPELEKSELWQLAKKVADGVREAANTVPYIEHYVFAGALISNATLIVSDVAFAVGKGKKSSAYDYYSARGHLFTAKSLLIMAAELGYVKDTKALMTDFGKLQKILDKEIELKEKTEEPEK